MFEVFGVLSSDLKAIRSREAEILPPDKADWPEFAALLEVSGEEEPIHHETVLPESELGEASEPTALKAWDAPRDVDAAERQESFPILLARTAAKPPPDDIQDVTADFARAVSVDSDQDIVAQPGLQPKIEAVPSHTNGQREPSAPLIGQPSKSIAGDRPTILPETVRATNPAMRDDTAQRALSQVPEPMPETVPLTQDAARQTVVVREPLLTPDKPHQQVRTAMSQVPVEELSPQPGGEIEAVSAVSHAALSATAQPVTAAQPALQQSTSSNVQSWPQARAADKDAEEISVRAQHRAEAAPPPPASPATPATGPLVGAPAFARPVMIDHLAKMNSDRERIEGDGTAMEARGPERSTSATSLTQLATGRAELPTHVAQQLAQALRGSPKGPVEVALQPEELGRVKMTITANEAGVVVSISAERQETFDMMRRHAALLSKELTDLGFGAVDLSFEHRGERQSQARGTTNPGHLDFPDLSAAELDALGHTGASVSGGLDRSKALDKRI